VDVMNHADVLRVGQLHFVVCEVNEIGVPVRVVPYLDAEGGRLGYLRIDLLYFRFALLWQRTSWARFPNEDYTRPDRYTLESYRRIARLDAALADGPHPRRYVGYVFRRELLTPDGEPVRWTEARLVGTLPAYECGSGGRAALGPLWVPYDLPPGHARARRRAADTLEVLWRLHIDGSVARVAGSQGAEAEGP
jgi:hypothetical protein